MGRCRRRSLFIHVKMSHFPAGRAVVGRRAADQTGKGPYSGNNQLYLKFSSSSLQAVLILNTKRSPILKHPSFTTYLCPPRTGRWLTQEEERSNSFFTCLAGIFPAWEKKEDDNFGSAAISRDDIFWAENYSLIAEQQREGRCAWRHFRTQKWRDFISCP